MGLCLRGVDASWFTMRRKTNLMNRTATEELQKKNFKRPEEEKKRERKRQVADKRQREVT